MLAGSMSSLTAMTILPQLDCSWEAPDLAAQGCVLKLHEDDGAQIGQPLVHHHAADALDPHALA
jgi:hypothetical protein